MLQPDPMSNDTVWISAMRYVHRRGEIHKSMGEKHMKVAQICGTNLGLTTAQLHKYKKNYEEVVPT